MYDLIPFAIGGGILLLGFLMVAMPRQMTMKEKRDDPAAVSKVRKCGIFEIVCGIKVYSTRRTLDRQLQEQQRQIEQAEEVEYAEVE